MCNPLTLLAVAGLGYGAYRDYRSKTKKTESAKETALNEINQQHQEKVEFNKLANSVQTTQPTTQGTINPDLATKLKQQKVPLNTAGTGATTLPSTVGLNLGGY